MRSVPFILFVCVLVILWNQALTGKVRVNGVIPSESLLKCWSCNETLNCIMMKNLTEISPEHCGINQPYCMVKQYHDKGEITSITRGCVSFCEAGCQSLVTLGLESCTSCCSSSFCNKYNAFSPNLTSNIFVISVMQVLHVYLFFYK